MFIDCEAWGKQAEFVSQYFAKGRPILIEGRLKLDQWEDKETKAKRSKHVVVVENVSFVDSKPGGGGGAADGRMRPRVTTASGGQYAPAAAAPAMGEEGHPVLNKALGLRACLTYALDPVGVAQSVRQGLAAAPNFRPPGEGQHPCPRTSSCFSPSPSKPWASSAMS
jgi:single-stranded DNA-binding protein